MKRTTEFFSMAILAVLLALSCTSVRRSRTMGSAATAAATIEPSDNPVRAGMNSQQVRDAWGEPREVVPDGASLGDEIWIYERARSSGDAKKSVVLRTQYRLTFRGGSLAGIEERPM